MYRIRPPFSDFNMGNARLTTTSNKAGGLGVVFDDNMLSDAHVSILHIIVLPAQELIKDKNKVSHTGV